MLNVLVTMRFDEAQLERLRRAAPELRVSCADAERADYAAVDVLAGRRIAGAAIDVFAEEPPPAGHPLYGVDNVIVSPHVSGFLPSYDDRCADLFAENLARYLADAPLLNLVDR